MYDTIKVYYIGGPADGMDEEFMPDCLADKIIITVPKLFGGYKEAVYKAEESGSDKYIFDCYRGTEEAESENR